MLSMQLVPAYRAFTVDSLLKLSFLDDLLVTVDERLLYDGMAQDSGTVCLSVCLSKCLSQGSQLS